MSARDPAAQRSASGMGPVYVGGLDRSGKTTMAAFLASHPDIAIPAVGSNMETYFYRQYGDLGRQQNFERCLEAMLHYKHVRFLSPDPARIRREFAAGPPTYARLFALFLMHFAERLGKPRWGAQTGLIERYAEQMFSAYPELRIVHMLRDPRDRYEASLARWPEGKGRAGGATARWRYSLALAERHARRHPDAYLIVRFEDLVTDTEATLRRVCRFLDAPFTPTMLEMDAAPKVRRALEAATRGSSGERLGEGERERAGGWGSHGEGERERAGGWGSHGEGERERAGGWGVVLSGDYIGGYRGRLDPAELAFMQLHLGRRMRAYGYIPDANVLSPAGRVRFALVDVPSQTARMVAWRTIEELQQRFPRWVRRKPGTRMIVDEPIEART